MTLTRTSMWRIKNVNSRFTANEEWFLGVDYNEDYVRNGSKPSDSRYLKRGIYNTRFKKYRQSI